MAGMPRFYQISLRTIFELMFVVAVVLAFIYWRNQPPRDPSGRYQFISTASGEQRGVFIDTQTGKAWRGWLGRTQWDSIPTPADPFTVPTPPPTPATVAKKVIVIPAKKESAAVQENH